MKPPPGQQVPPAASSSPFSLTLNWMHVAAALWHNGYALGLDCGPPNVLLRDITAPESTMPPPEALRPTDLQATVIHIQLIDCIPFATVRDRILSGSFIVNMDALRDDLLNMGLSCWGRRPWDPRAWELPAAFVDKWWWLLDDQVVGMTNFWREQRAEEPLVWRGNPGGEAFLGLV